MKLIIEGHDKLYDLQSIASAFFPGQSFSDGLPIVESKVVHSQNEITCHTLIKGENRSVNKRLSVAANSADGVRTAVKGAFFEAAKEYTGIIPPWGEFSGIRPVKYMASLSDNITDAKEQFINTLGVSRGKAQLCEKVMLLRENMNLEQGVKDFSLYISIPFCPSRCAYCSFISQAGEKMLSLLPEYLLALKHELECAGKIAAENGLRLHSIYIGGGTPGILSAKESTLLLNAIRSSFNLSSLKEFTVEVGRPDCITEEKLRVLYEYGVDRISINPQTLNDNVLAAIGRKHTAKQFFEAYDTAQKIGFRSINTDIIVGLPEDTPESFSNTLSGILSLGPGNITVHSLCLKKSSWLKVDDNTGFLKNKEAIEMSELANRLLLQNGYEPYYMYKQKNAVGSLENTGFCKKGLASYYNIIMMDDIQNVIGLGAGSTTKLFCGIDPLRVYNCKYPFEYISHKEKLEENLSAINEFFKKH